MRVLAHIHTLNDADVIDGIIEALRRQTQPIDGILVVDNGSTDDTLDRPSLHGVTVVREPVNLGTSGAVDIGIRFAFDNGYDWVWLFDADSTPEPDALEKLLDLYDALPAGIREQTAFLGCLGSDLQDGIPHHGCVVTGQGVDKVRPAAHPRYYECHVTIWSGCLYRLEAVRRIGLPNTDYVLDWGEVEYGYRVMRAGYHGYIHQDAILHHNVGGRGYSFLQIRFGPLQFKMVEAPPIRCYYGCRNTIYFLIHEIKQRHPKAVIGAMSSVGRQIASYLLKPLGHGKQLRACVLGFWHGITGNIEARY